MTIKYSYVIILITFIFTIGYGCRKDEPQQIALNGKATYMSPLLSATDSFALKKQKIQVQDVSTAAIYELTTDSAGSFSMPGWPTDKTFILETRLVQNDSDENRVVYVAKNTVSNTGIADISLLAKIDTASYKALLLSVKDMFGGKIPGANVLIYTSRAVATADTGFVGLGTLVNFKTNYLGSCLSMQLPADSLFIKSKYKADTVINFRSNILALKLEKNYTDTSVIVR